MVGGREATLPTPRRASWAVAPPTPLPGRPSCGRGARLCQQHSAALRSVWPPAVQRRTAPAPRRAAAVMEASPGAIASSADASPPPAPAPLPPLVADAPPPDRKRSRAQWAADEFAANARYKQQTGSARMRARACAPPSLPPQRRARARRRSSALPCTASLGTCQRRTLTRCHRARCSRRWTTETGCERLEAFVSVHAPNCTLSAVLLTSLHPAHHPPTPHVPRAGWWSRSPPTHLRGGPPPTL